MKKEDGTKKKSNDTPVLPGNQVAGSSGTCVAKELNTGVKKEVLDTRVKEINLGEEDNQPSGSGIGGKRKRLNRASGKKVKKITNRGRLTAEESNHKKNKRGEERLSKRKVGRRGGTKRDNKEDTQKNKETHRRNSKKLSSSSSSSSSSTSQELTRAESMSNRGNARVGREAVWCGVL